MRPDFLAKYDRRVPRYTSYPTAVQFGPSVGAAAYLRWLAALDPAMPLSLYVHVPFCDSLCWFCGCHTKIIRRHEPVASYLGWLQREIDLVADALGARRRACHIHLGGGSPSILAPDDLKALFDRLRARFEVPAGTEIAVEVDPRGLDPALVDTMADAGVNRASVGVQDVNPVVQRAVNRNQPFAETESAVTLLRAAGIESINVDLMYGLPHQTVERVLATVEAVLELRPQRVCLFGYAHVPWMKRHQRLIDEAALPGAADRFAQYLSAAARLRQAGYVWIGLDHFARPDDELAVALRERGLHRNFQGYTADGARARLGFGPSAIGTLPEGFVQNAVPLHAYEEALACGAPPSARGLRLVGDDRLRGAVIERLMCYLEVDLAEVGRAFGCDPAVFAEDLAELAEMEADGIVRLDGAMVHVTEWGRPFVRTVCAAFDRYLRSGETRHARAV